MFKSIKRRNINEFEEHFSTNKGTLQKPKTNEQNNFKESIEVG